ncbi:hypothetical protein [Burkholderia pseudomallei]|uniref:hypothetical protein n=1 Tax=Burkholderia pseudomallei TaxID=28450 RepID=UPI001E4DFB74|nr:hypothetical protein [Burkholderia pseudomallei]
MTILTGYNGAISKMNHHHQGKSIPIDAHHQYRAWIQFVSHVTRAAEQTKRAKDAVGMRQERY